MNRVTAFSVGFCALVCAATFSQDKTTSATPPKENWSYIMVETQKGFWPLRKYDEAAQKHLRNFDPSFKVFTEKTAWIRMTNEVAIEYSSGLGKSSFMVCMDRDFKILGVKKSTLIDGIGDPSAVSAPKPSLCD
ncbi:MAG: hypothetical protein ACO1QB_11055 [Verrucomicrobiales bacterium]